MMDQLIQNILNLDKHNQDIFFKMLSENAAVLLKIVPNAPLLAYIVSGLHNDGSPIVQAYIAWQQNTQ